MIEKKNSKITFFDRAIGIALGINNNDFHWPHHRFCRGLVGMVRREEQEGGVLKNVLYVQNNFYRRIKY